jgi:hypothetical protein
VWGLTADLSDEIRRHKLELEEKKAAFFLPSEWYGFYTPS